VDFASGEMGRIERIVPISKILDAEDFLPPTNFGCFRLPGTV
jgi:hypothetical protein